MPMTNIDEYVEESYVILRKLGTATVERLIQELEERKTCMGTVGRNIPLPRQLGARFGRDPRFVRWSRVGDRWEWKLVE